MPVLCDGNVIRLSHTHNSGMDNGRVLKIGTCLVRQALNSTDNAMVKRSKIKVTRSNEIMQKTSNISRKRHRIVKIYPSYRKSRSPERMAVSQVAVSVHAQCNYV